MVGHGGSSAGSYLADPTSPIPSHCAVIILFKSASIVVTRQKQKLLGYMSVPYDGFMVKTSQDHEMFCHDLDITGLNPGQLKLRVHSPSFRLDKNVQRSFLILLLLS